MNIKGSMIADNFEKTIEHSETLLFRTAPVPMYLLSKIVKKKILKLFIVEREQMKFSLVMIFFLKIE